MVKIGLDAVDKETKEKLQALAEEPKQTLGLAMIAQNEQVHIPSSLAQFYHVVDDIVVVDGGSTDETVSWAERMGARVIHRPFDNDFSAQKNFAIEQLDTDWVYLHDPDERLEPPATEILPLILTHMGQKFLAAAQILPERDEKFDCLGFARKNFIDGVQTTVYPDYQYRLFRNYCRFEGRVHEKITGFSCRTEVDYKRPDAARPSEKESEDAKVEQLFDFDQTSRFNILHYKSSVKQQEQNDMYAKILKGEL